LELFFYPFFSGISLPWTAAVPTPLVTFCTAVDRPFLFSSSELDILPLAYSFSAPIALSCAFLSTALNPVDMPQDLAAGQSGESVFPIPPAVWPMAEPKGEGLIWKMT